MPTPLRSQDPNPKDIQFKHFGVMSSGEQSKSSLFTSITVNVLLALIIVIIGAAARTTVINNAKHADLISPVNIKEKPPEPKPPKPPPPKIIPPKPVPVPPKVKLPDVKIPDPPKPVEVKVMPAKPLPVVMPAPPKAVVAAAAPKPVAVNLAQSASVVNHDIHPSAVALGSATNPIAPSSRPATSSINLGQRGLAGMPASNTGGGPPSSRVNLGSGSPGGSLNGTGVKAVQGVALGGVTGGTGNRPGNGVGVSAPVKLGGNPPPANAQVSQVTKAPQRSAPEITAKPKPIYTAEATAMHLEGTVSVRIRIAANGAVTVLGVTQGLGHGLDESAVRACQGIRAKPALDSSGNPIDWEGVVKITFQLA